MILGLIFFFPNVKLHTEYSEFVTLLKKIQENADTLLSKVEDGAMIRKILVFVAICACSNQGSLTVKSIQAASPSDPGQNKDGEQSKPGDPLPAVPPPKALLFSDVEPAMKEFCVTGCHVKPGPKGAFSLESVSEVKLALKKHNAAKFAAVLSAAPGNAEKIPLMPPPSVNRTEKMLKSQREDIARWLATGADLVP